MRFAAASILCLLVAAQVNSSPVTVTAGVTLTPPSGFYVANFDPTLNSPDTNEIYDANFIPGFRVGLTNVSVEWESGNGYGSIGYAIGPWQHLEVEVPHLAVGPQCCNFVEVPRTQQYRRAEWGDFYHVLAGFSSPGVNMPDFTSNFTTPAYVGLRTDWQWVVSVSLNWSQPRLLNQKNEWATIGITATQYVPNVPAKLVYTVVNFWMDNNSTSVLSQLPGSTSTRFIAGSRVVIYPAYQMPSGVERNQTITINLTPYLTDTLDVLGYANSTAPPPVISYVYLNVEGYNVRWNSTLYSFFVMSDESRPGQTSPASILYVASFSVAGLVSALLTVYLITKRRRDPRHS